MSNKPSGTAQKRQGYDFLVDVGGVEDPSSKAVQDEQSKLEEAMKAAQDALRATEQMDVDFTEDDMNDPHLLAEMERLERGEAASEVPKPSVNRAPSANPTAPSDAQMQVDGVAKGHEGTKNEADEYSERMLALVNRRMREYFEAAVAAKNAGSPAAKPLAQNYAKLKELKAQLESGELIDEEDLPGPPPDIPLTTSPAPSANAKASASPPNAKQGASKKAAAASPASFSADPTPSSPASTSQGTGTMSPAATSSVPPSPALTAAELRERKFAQLEAMLLAQTEELKGLALAANSANKKSEAMAIIQRRKAVIRDLELVRLAHSTPGTPPPSFHIDTIEHTTEVINMDVSAHEIEIRIVKLEDVKPPSLEETVLDSYVVCEFPYPDPNKPTLLTTPVVKGTLSPTFDFVQKVRIERNKALLRAFKKKVTLQVWKPKSWFLGSAKLIGRAELKLLALSDVSDIHEVLEIWDEGGHKSTGGKMHVSVRLRMPLLKKQVQITKEKVLVIDKHYIGTEAAENPPTSNDLLSQSTVASVTAVTPSHDSAVAANDLSASKLTMSTMAPSQTGNAMQVDAEPLIPEVVLRPTTPVAPIVATPLEATPSTHTKPESTHTEAAPKATSSAQAPATAAPHAAPAAAKKEDFDFNSARWIISHAVLEWRKGVLTTQIAQATAKKVPQEEIDPLHSQLDDVEHKITLLIVAVQSGTLSQEEYIRRVKAKMEEEKELYTRLTSVGRNVEAAECKKRLQIMEEELGGG